MNVKLLLTFFFLSMALIQTSGKAVFAQEACDAMLPHCHVSNAFTHNGTKPACDCERCQIVPELKTKSKAVYDIKIIYYCQHRFPALSIGCGSGRDCGSGESYCCKQCLERGKVRSRRVLLKKFVTIKNPAVD